MALTELQQFADKEDFYNNCRTVAGDYLRAIERIRQFAERLGDMTAADLDTLSVPNTGSIRSDIVAFRVALQEIVSIYDNNPVTPVKAHDDVMDQVRRALI